MGGEREHGRSKSDPNLRPRSKDAYFVDLPFSSRELDQAWVEICAFEHDGQALRPSAATLLALWKSILINAMVNGLDLGKRVLKEELVAFAIEDGFVEETLHSLLRRLQADEGEVMLGCQLVLLRSTSYTD